MAPSNEPATKTFLQRLKEGVESQLGRIGKDLDLIHDAVDTVFAGGIIDDTRNHMIEKIVDIAASLPNGSHLRDDLSAKFVKTLWNRLEHPPISYIGDQFKYRSADGSNNNVSYPSFGQAGSPYARSVVPQHMKQDVMPDPGLIFDTLLVRDGKAKPHPNQISSMLFYLATIIIHDLFHTDNADRTRTQASSYLDLGPLYGHNQAQQNKVRTFKDGLLKKDAFSESRLLGQPPGVCALIIAFNRFHNYVVGEMAVINESGRFSLPRGMTPSTEGYAEAMKKRDNDLFQTGRLVTCGLYVNMILGDYLRGILNLNQNPHTPDSDWSLDPRGSSSVVGDSSVLARGTGNQVSVEFSMIYAWHSAISDHDEEWAKNFTKKIFGPDVDIDKLSFMQFLGGLKKWKDAVPDDPTTWEFGGKKRTSDGSFSDKDLVELITTATQNAGGAFGARNVPAIMKAIEILGIQHGRDWNVASLNEVRLYFGLKPHATFLEVNSDPAIAEALQSVYETPDDIELYVGLKVEEAKLPFYPGSGLCPGSTVGTAVLADAVALVRGDRFYTVDYSPANLTNFGFKAANSTFDVASGGVMYRLLNRAFPGWYHANSVYALYPLTTPEKNRAILKGLKKENEFVYEAPSFMASPTPIVSWKGVTDVLSDPAKFKVALGRQTKLITGHDFMPSDDSPTNIQQRDFIKGCLYKPENGPAEVQRFYENTMTKLLKKSRKIPGGYTVDIIRDVGNLAHATFIGHFFGIPLADSSSATAFTAQELYELLGAVLDYIFFDVDAATSFQKYVKASKAYKKLFSVMSACLASKKKPVESILTTYGPKLIERLSVGGKSTEEIVWNLLGTAVGALNQVIAWSSMIDLFLSDQYYSHWSNIQTLAQSDKPADFEKLKKYVLEGLRLSGFSSGVLRVVSVASTTIVDDERNIQLKLGEQVCADFSSASRDPRKFSEPEKVKLDRPEESYLHLWTGPHSGLGGPIVLTAAATMLKSVATLKNLRRVSGKAGDSTTKTIGGAVKVYLTTDASAWSSLPQSKKVAFDGF